MDKGIFVVFEGPDGSGKSSLSKLFFDYLINANHNVIITREPGGNNIKLSEEIRNIVLNNKNLNISYEAEAYLFAASRAQHVNELIIPNLEQNKIVICDRFIFSSLAYQGYARNLGIEKVYEMNQMALKHLRPDITFYIDINYELGLKRIKDNHRDTNRLDDELKIHKDVEIGYKKVIATYGKEYNCIVLDGTKTLNELQNEVIKYFNKFIESKTNAI